MTFNNEAVFSHTWVNTAFFGYINLNFNIVNKVLFSTILS